MNSGMEAIWLSKPWITLRKAPARKGMSANGIGGESTMKTHSTNACTS